MSDFSTYPVSYTHLEDRIRHNFIRGLHPDQQLAAKRDTRPSECQAQNGGDGQRGMDGAVNALPVPRSKILGDDDPSPRCV